MTAPPEELSRIVRLDRVPTRGVTIDVTANEVERAALARRFDLLELPMLEAEITVQPGLGGVWAVTGRLRAKVVQACVVSLDPVAQSLDEAIDLRFAAGAKASADDPDAPEPLEGDTLDVGTIVADHLSLALDPFPRAPGATYEPAPEPAEAKPNPFAALESLKGRLKGEE